MTRARMRIAAATMPVAALGIALALAACGGGIKNSSATSSAKTGTTVTVTSGSQPASASTTPTTASAPAAATTPSTRTASTVLGRTNSNLGVTFEVNALKRTSADIVELDFTVIGGPHADGLGLADGGLGGSRDVSNVTLVDEHGQKEYLTVQDSSGGCLCSDNLFADTPGFQANTTGHFYADITAPPPTVTSVDVMIPTAPPIHNVAISQ